MNEVNPVLQEYIDWLSLPPEEREPKNQKELAKKLGVSEPQLSIWKSKLSLQSAEPSDIAKLRKHILEEAKKGGNAQMARLAWDIMNPKNEDKEADFTADEYINIGIKLRDQLQEEYRQSNGNCPVCGKPKEIRNGTRLDTESGSETDREVATVAVSTRPD